jgi:hypothetical protein
VRSKENQRDGRKEDGLFDVRKKTAGFLTYHGFLTIASSSRIISLDMYKFRCCGWACSIANKELPGRCAVQARFIW